MYNGLGIVPFPGLREHLIMSRITVDAATRAILHNLDDFLIFCDESGRTLGYFQPGTPPASRADEKVRSPISSEEIERRRSLRTGVPLEEVLKQLENR